jgi:ABC-type phosphate transport system substrate-binding protein
MQKTLFTLATVITTAAAGTSFYVATQPQPTDTQKELSSTANTIAIAGATAIFSLLNENDEDSKH